MFMRIEEFYLLFDERWGLLEENITEFAGKKEYS
jgi:hypothetical protein